VVMLTTKGSSPGCGSKISTAKVAAAASEHHGSGAGGGDCLRVNEEVGGRPL